MEAGHIGRPGNIGGILLKLLKQCYTLHFVLELLQLGWDAVGVNGTAS